MKTVAIAIVAFLIGIALESTLIEWASREGQIADACAPLFTGEGITE